MSGEGEEGEGEEGKLPSVDHGRRTDRGRDKNKAFRMLKDARVYRIEASTLIWTFSYEEKYLLHIIVEIKKYLGVFVSGWLTVRPVLFFNVNKAKHFKSGNNILICQL